jgi:hypothetical protein
MTTAAVETAIIPRPVQEAQKSVAPMPQYMQGFEGAASAPFPAEALTVLAAPVDGAEVETKPNGIVYLPGVWYRRILTRAFGAGAWALLPRGPARTMGEIVIYHGALYVLGRFVSEAVGECETRGGMSYASSLEGARTDCLTRCCKDLGMAAELWDPEWRDGWQRKYCSKTWQEAQGNKKAGFVFKKLDKPNGAPAPTAGRNVGPTVAALESTMAKAAAEMKASGEKISGAPVSTAARPETPPSDDGGMVSSVVDGENTGAGGQAADSPDSGEAASAAEIEMLRAQVKKVGWASPKARSWLKVTFGESTAAALTKDQAAAGLALLLAAQKDDNDDAYAAVYAKLKAEGKVL